MNLGARREEPEQGRGQPFVPLFSGRRVLVVVLTSSAASSLIRSGAAKRHKRSENTARA
jgi:hypothetical protein